MQPEELMAKINAMEGVEAVDNQPVCNAMAVDVDIHSMCGSRIGEESLISGAFTDAMPNADTPIFEAQEPELAQTLEIPMMGRQPS